MKIQFGIYSIQTKRVNQQPFIYDIIRKKWIVITPEEQVRQVWIHYLIYNLGISESKIAVEKGLKINGKIKRFDICVYDNLLQPNILIECKAPNLILSTPNFEQLANYNIALKANKFILTNGVSHLGYQISNNKIEAIDTLIENTLG